MAAPSSAEKSRMQREQMKARGLKEVRLWAPDLDAPGAREALHDEMARINTATEAGELQRWMDAASAEVEAMIEAEEAGRQA